MHKYELNLAGDEYSRLMEILNTTSIGHNVELLGVDLVLRTNDTKEATEKLEDSFEENQFEYYDLGEEKRMNNGTVSKSKINN